AIRATWAARPKKPIDHAGPYYRIRDYNRQAPLRFAPPPIYLGVTLPRMTALAGEVADGVIVNAMTSVAWMRDVTLPTLRQSLEAAGRARADLDVGRLIYCAIADDAADAYELVRPALAYYLGIPYFGDLCERHGFGAELAEGLVAMRRGDVA